MTTTKRRKQKGFMDVRRNGRLLFRYDPDRDLIEVKQKGTRQTEVVDLRQYRTIDSKD